MKLTREMKEYVIDYMELIDDEEISELLDDNDDNEMLIFYNKCMENNLHLADADRYAILNTLIGYDIGVKNAMNISNYLWEDDIEVLELPYDKDNKKCVEEAINVLNIDIDLSNWKNGEFTYYEYHVA